MELHTITYTLLDPHRLYAVNGVIGVVVLGGPITCSSF